jgi:GNAT superfamily N-acetyltransferase
MIKMFAEESDLVSARSAIKDIFFLSSNGTENLSKDDKEVFFETWSGFYLDSLPKQVFLFKSNSGTTVGYLTGCYDSAGAAALYRRLFYFRGFNKYYQNYPAHFHVNCHPDLRGRGIGGQLVEAFIKNVAQRRLAGVHLVTGAKARNRSFYDLHGFYLQGKKTFGGKELVLLGRNC